MKRRKDMIQFPHLQIRLTRVQDFMQQLIFWMEKDVPNVMIHPVGIVTKDDVDQYENVGADEVGCPTYDWDWVRSELEAQ